MWHKGRGEVAGIGKAPAKGERRWDGGVGRQSMHENTVMKPLLCMPVLKDYFKNMILYC